MSLSLQQTNRRRRLIHAHRHGFTASTRHILNQHLARDQLSDEDDPGVPRRLRNPGPTKRQRRTSTPTRHPENPPRPPAL